MPFRTSLWMVNRLLDLNLAPLITSHHCKIETWTALTTNVQKRENSHIVDAAEVRIEAEVGAVAGEANGEDKVRRVVDTGTKTWVVQNGGPYGMPFPSSSSTLISEASRIKVDKRARNVENQEAAKRMRLEGKEEDLPVYATRFSKEEIDAQEKKPKRKVAVMIGYSGSGYKGMQL